MSYEDNAGYYCACCLVTTVLCLALTLPFVFTTMPDTERGVAYSRLFARFEDEILESGGVHNKPYNAHIYRWPRTEFTIEFGTNSDYPTIVCNSLDGILISLQVSFQYFPQQDKLLTLTKLYQEVDNWRVLMINQAESSIRHVCGDFSADDFQTSRGAVTLKMENEVRENAAAKFFAVITKLQVRNVDRPASFEQAVRDKENARSEIKLAENEEVQAVIKAQTKVDVAIQERLRLLDSANTTARIRVAEALNEADVILDKYQQLANVYKKVQTNYGLTVKGILSYISNEVFHSDVTIAVDLPAEVTFKDEL